MKDTIRKLLLKLQTVMRTDLLYATKGSFWLLLGSVGGSFASLIVAVVFARFVPKETYGNYKYVLSTVGLLSAFTFTGLSDAIVRSVARGFDKSLGLGFWKNWQWSALMIVGLVGLGGWYLFQGNLELGFGMLFAAAFAPLLNSAALFPALLQGKKEFRVNTLYNIWRSLLPALVLIIVVLFTQNIIALVAAYFIANSAVTLFLYRKTQKTFITNDKIDPEMLSFGKHLSLVGIIGAVSLYLDRILIFHYLGAAETAIYSFAIAFPEQLDSVVSNLQTLALPKFSARSKEDIQKTLFRKILIVFLALIPVTGLYILVAPTLYRLFLPQYMEAVPYTIGYIFVLIATGTARLPMAFLTSQHAIKERYIIGIFAPILRIVLMLVLIHTYGIWGVIFARVVTKYINLLVGLVLVRRL